MLIWSGVLVVLLAGRGSRMESVAQPLRVETTRSTPETRRRLSGPALRTFLEIATLWELTEDEQRLALGRPAKSTYRNWARAARMHCKITLSSGVLMRVSAVLGIYQALRVLHTTEQNASRWLRQPHAASVFGDKPPMTLVCSGTQAGLMAVLRFLSAARNGLYMAPTALDAASAPYPDAAIVMRNGLRDD